MIAWFAGQPLALKIALGVAGALCLCFGLWFLWLRHYLEWQNVKTLDIKDRVGLKNEFVKTGAQIVGGLVFLLTILVAFLNYQETQKKNEADLEQAKEKQVTELYVKAIEQLGSDKLPVILGGIYALERIARDAPKKYHGPIIRVLTAYVRQNAPWPPEDPVVAQKRRPWTKKGLKIASQPKTGKKGPGPPKHGKDEKGEESRPEPDTDIQAVLTVIGRLGPARDGQGKPQRPDLRFTDLRGADLLGVHLEGARLDGAHLEKANLEDAYLQTADLLKAHLEMASLGGAHLEAVDLRGANLEEADLEDADLERAKLWNTNLKEASLWKARLERANLQASYLQGAHLWEAHLEGAYLESAIGLTQRQIDSAYCDAKTALPPGLKPSSKKKPSP